MTVLRATAQLTERQALVHAPGSALGALARSLRADLEPLLGSGAPWIPPDKARLTRLGGRCPTHGILLDFDPWEPHRHLCATCGVAYEADEHYRWWVMNYQLWLAERAVHAAALWRLTDDAPCAALAEAILLGCARAYERWPNRDNVLGPTRPFFSTYLESIWTLQLTVALSLLEGDRGAGSVGEEVRERLVRPSVALIASFDEGRSNRQVYHDAAMAAAGALLGDEALIDRAFYAPSGFAVLATEGLLDDGSWYEGENYHLFAHRGLWYGVTIADALGLALPAEARRRVREGFATPFATALPDCTFPSRRDSQYRVSLRQWRMAESCELGLARGDDPRLEHALAALYDPAAPSGDTGRARSTAEAERNVPGARLDRTSLGWKGLLFARAALPPLGTESPASVHLAGQGYAVIRRRASAYVALDYGTSGGGHGHPDRLNLWLVLGTARVLEDVGTGSYVDPTLHWYRSTLAHNAPLVDGRSQWRVDGTLGRFVDDGSTGIVSARATIAPGVDVERTLVVRDGYLVDEVRWRADRVVTFDLPWHLDANPDPPWHWRAATLSGARGLEDGFEFVAASEVCGGGPMAHFATAVDGVDVSLWCDCSGAHEWWRAVAPGPPGEARRRFLMLRARGDGGSISSVIAWRLPRERAAVHGVERAGDRLVVRLAGGTAERHRRLGDAWWLATAQGEVAMTIFDPPAPGHPLLGAEAYAPSSVPARVVLRPVASIPDDVGALAAPCVASADVEGVVRVALGREHYRRSEESWEEAGRPTATVALVHTPEAVVVEVFVCTPHATFAPARDRNPLDNEHPDINSDGVQLYLGGARGSGRYHSWLLVPVGEGGSVRVTPRAAVGTAVPVAAAARLTSDGWAMRITMPRGTLVQGPEGFTLDLIVNEITPDRERRRGQLVLSGGHDEWIYLRGDRQDPARAFLVQLADA